MNDTTGKKSATRNSETRPKQVIAKSAGKKADEAKKQAEADIAVVVGCKARIAEAFYDMGEALSRLAAPGVALVVGFSSFEQLCEQALDLSVTQAKRLISIVKNVPRAEALKMGQTRAAALVELAEATPQADTAMTLSRKTLALPSGEKVNLRTASTRQLQAAAREVRAASRQSTPARGRTVREADRKVATRLERAFHDLGAEGVRVAAIAGNPGAGASLRIEGLDVESVGLLGRVAKRLAAG